MIMIFAGISDVPVPGGGFFANSSELKNKILITIIALESLTILKPCHYNYKVLVHIVYC